MRLENQVVSVELSKMLKEQGIGQIGEYSWLYSPSDGGYWISHQKVEALELLAKSHPKSVEWNERVVRGIFTAFSATEISIMLPDLLEDNGRQYELVIIRDSSEEWLCRYCRNNNMLDTHPEIESSCAASFSDTLATMLSHLIEEGKVTPEECNKRLTES